jgi:chromosome partitioning protein
MVLVLAHQKGGVGKSTVAWNLATLFQKKGYDIELVDLDTQQTLFYTNEIRKKDKKLKPLKLIRFEKTEDFKRYLKEDDETKLSIVDVGGFDSDLSRLAIAFADMVVTPVSDRSFELLGLKSFEKILAAISHVIDESITVHVLLNNLNPRKVKLDTLKDFIEKSPHFTLMQTVLRTRADYDKSAARGKNVVEYKKDSKAAAEIKSLFKEVRATLSI